MNESTKRIVLTKFWIGDRVYHIADGSLGIIICVTMAGEPYSVKYEVLYTDRKAEFCLEMELSHERIFNEGAATK